MARTVSIGTVAASLGNIYIGPQDKRRLNVPALSHSFRLLSRVPSLYSYTRSQKQRYLKILCNIALNDLMLRRGTSRARQSPALSRTLLPLTQSLPSAGTSEALTDAETLTHANALALGVYSLNADELLFQRNRETELDYNSRVTTKIRSVEKKYRSLLIETQTAARSGNRIMLRGTLGGLVDFSRGKLFSLAQRVGLSSSMDVTDKRVMRAELRVAGLIRRTAMLVAACVYLDQRLADPRLNRTTQKLAKRRHIVSRELPDLNGAITSDQNFQNGQVYEILTRIEDIQILKRGDKPLSTAKCVGLSPNMQVAYKAIWQSGISTGPIWCRAKYKAPDAAFELEFEGIAQHAGSVWEDWLASEAREAFDINVGNLHAEPSLPLLRTRASGLDLMNRLGGF